jgi:hypothetical protein
MQRDVAHNVGLFSTARALTSQLFLFFLRFEVEGTLVICRRKPEPDSANMRWFTRKFAMHPVVHPYPADALFP